jgi:DNA-binding MarR family transcriptional regulator
MAQAKLSAVPSGFRLAEPDYSARGAKLFSAVLEADGRPSGLVRSVQRARTRRGQFLNSQLFSDPAWDILLELFAAQLEQTRLSIGGLTLRCGVRPTTVLRWLDIFSAQELIERHSDRLDGRRVYVSLSYKGFCAMSDVFSTVPRAFPM